MAKAGFASDCGIGHGAVDASPRSCSIPSQLNPAPATAHAQRSRNSKLAIVSACSSIIFSSKGSRPVRRLHSGA